MIFKWIQEGERYDVALAMVRTGSGGKEVGGWSWGKVGASSRDVTTDLFLGGLIFGVCRVSERGEISI